MRRLSVLAAGAVLMIASGAPAQIGKGGIGGLLGGNALTGVARASAGNAAGLLSYCVKNKLVGQANAGSVLGKLTGRQDVTASPEFSAGQSGQVISGGKSALSLADVKGQLRTRACDLVLKRAGSFL